MFFLQRFSLDTSLESVLSSSSGGRLTRELLRFNLSKRTDRKKRISLLTHMLRMLISALDLIFQAPNKTLLRKVTSEL